MYKTSCRSIILYITDASDIVNERGTRNEYRKNPDMQFTPQSEVCGLVSQLYGVTTGIRWKASHTIMMLQPDRKKLQYLICIFLTQ